MLILAKMLITSELAKIVKTIVVPISDVFISSFMAVSIIKLRNNKVMLNSNFSPVSFSRPLSMLCLPLLFTLTARPNNKSVTIKKNKAINKYKLSDNTPATNDNPAITLPGTVQRIVLMCKRKFAPTRCMFCSISIIFICNMLLIFRLSLSNPFQFLFRILRAVSFQFVFVSFISFVIISLFPSLF